MTYTFKSAATSDILMLQKDGAHLLKIIGKDPDAPGIIEVDQMPAAIATLQAAVAFDKSAHKGEKLSDPDDNDLDRVSLSRRAHPLLQMLIASKEAGEPVVWGV